MLALRCDSMMKNGITAAIAKTPTTAPTTITLRNSNRLNKSHSNSRPATHAAAAVQMKKYEKTRTAKRPPAANEYKVRLFCVSLVRARHIKMQNTKNNGKTTDGW